MYWQALMANFLSPLTLTYFINELYLDDLLMSIVFDLTMHA